MEEIKNKKRIFEYDLMRVIFMLMVLGIHVLTKITNFSEEYNTVWTIVNILTNFFMICNPLFFMLSGKFNLNKEFSSKEDYKKYYKSKVINIFIPFLLVSIIVYCIFNYDIMTIKDFFEQFIGGTIEGTYWFIYTLLGIMILSPFFSKMVKNMSLYDKKIFFWIACGIMSILTILLATGKNTAIKFATFGIISWNFYYLVGSFIEEIFSTHKSRKTMIFIGFVAFVVQFLIERFYNSSYRLYDPSPVLTFEAIGLYFLVLEFVKIKSGVLKKIISFIAKYSYIFYLFHSVVIQGVFKVFRFDLNVNFARNMLYGIIAYIVTFVIAMMCSIVFKYIIDSIRKLLGNKGVIG